ncbi:baseplate J/gp47 family protein [Neobacillus niacini]|uniref:baseplate J/gp47 family protein n=1 Tax=Neobacillus niacini TaxID=86668 RepID=UPI002854B3D5|nr:baseplate J/gp47 family protein [Neobacillus niacini]MDR7001553.1 putative phage protein gp47/JayE [Neobacillus niacini]
MAYEDKTPDVIHASMLENVDPEIDQREGSVTHDLTMPAAIEIANAYIELDAVLTLGFADTTEDNYLDMRAGEHGVTRRQAVVATGSVTLTGPDNTVVPSGTRLQTSGTSPIFFVTTADVTIVGGTATVGAEAEEAGAAGNVAIGEINALAPGDLYGIVSVTNAANFDGGVDTEDDESLLARLKDRVQNPVTSGNAAHYRQWALEVAGVGDAKVYPIWNGGGTVKVVLLDADKTAPAQSVVDAVSSHIEENRPIGATVTVVGATEVPINISVTLTLDSGKTVDDAKAEITSLLTDYLKTLAFVDSIVRYSKIASLVLDAESVIDYSSLTVNGGTANITIADASVAVAGTVTA